jgi:hypothetical protein
MLKLKFLLLFYVKTTILVTQVTQVTQVSNSLHRAKTHDEIYATKDKCAS